MDMLKNSVLMGNRDISIAYYDAVPAFLEAKLDRLYQHLNSSLCHYAVKRRAEGVGAYIAAVDGVPTAIFLLRQEKRRISVINEMIGIAPEEIDRFAHYMFARFPSVSAIRFSLIGKEIGQLSYPFQQYGHGEDVVVSLPATEDAYFSSLGSKLRHNIRHQMKAIAADHPGLEFKTLENGAIEPAFIDQLIELKKKNMDEKKVRFGLEADEIAWMRERAKTGGLLVAAFQDGRVCAGSLSFRLCDNYFAQVVAYDTRLMKYSPGLLCAYIAMREKIQRGAKEAHLSWGRQDYKFKLKGVLREMACLDIYRSRFHYLLNGAGVIRKATATSIADAKLAMLDNEHRPGALPWAVRKTIGTLRAIKRARFRAAAAPGSDAGRPGAR
jgi:hypothetical protein